MVWWLRLAGVVITALVLAWQVVSLRDPASSGVLARVDAVLYDWRFQALTPSREALLPIVIVDLDEASLQREGRWPWDRSRVAQLIQALRGHGAGLIGFDVVFSEAMDNPVRRILEEADLSAQQMNELAALAPRFDGDAALAAELDSSVVLGFFLHNEGADAGVLPPPLLTLPDEEAASSSLPAMSSYTASLRLLADAGASSGFVVAVPDADGVIRRVPLMLRHGAQVYASLALELARLALGAPWLQFEPADTRGQGGIGSVRLGRSLRIPLDEKAGLLVPYKGGAGSYPYLSASGILRGDAPASQLALLDNAIVLVGTSALGLSDLRSTPLQTAYPGVEAHANMLDALLLRALGHDTLYLAPDWAPAATLAVLLILGLLLALGLPGRSPRIMLVVYLCVLFAVVLGNAALWQYAHLALPLAAPIMLISVVALGNIISGHFLANRQRHAIQSLFGEYVPPEHVARMIERPELLNDEGEQREMTVLFADVRNFTATSEHLSANQLKLILNRYLGAVTEEIFAQQGTIDKYVGDMVMAFWNAPLDDPHHATHAVKAALAMQVRLAGLRTQFEAEGLPALRMGIGLNTGVMNVGDMGSHYRRAYTVLGDAVNLGARLEGLTSYYGLPILVSEHVRAQAPDFVYRVIDRVRVKGREAILDISEPMALADGDEQLQERARFFEQAVMDYRAQRWGAAADAFRQIGSQWPQDAYLCELYLQRMVDTKMASLPPDWDAAFDHVQK